MLTIYDVRNLLAAERPEQFTSTEIYADTPAGEALRAQFRQWCKDERVYYYARPRESFSLYEGRKLAAAAGCDRLWPEDLS
jgi:hypothetical protein